jgi:hypothetical protein
MKYVFNLKRMRVAPMMVDIAARQKQWEAAGRTLVARLDAAVPPLTPDQLTTAYSTFVQNVSARRIGNIFSASFHAASLTKPRVRIVIALSHIQRYHHIKVSSSPPGSLISIFAGDCRLVAAR